jgi:polyhydroxyalkanoate synthesis regulator phasin
MTGEIAAALFAFVGLLLTQALLHRRWTREQDGKREEMGHRLAEERRKEHDDLLHRMAEQNNAVVENALRIAEVHQQDAERARVLALENAQSHLECRQEVATLAGKIDELRERIAENERTMGEAQRVQEEDRGIKHDALTALTISEGTVDLVKKLVPNCTCHAFAPIEHLVTSFHPRAPGLVEANARIRHPTEDP